MFLFSAITLTGGKQLEKQSLLRFSPQFYLILSSSHMQRLLSFHISTDVNQDCK